MAIFGELVRAMGRGARNFAAGSVSGPTLAAGVFTIATGLTNVDHFSVVLRTDPLVDDRVIALEATESGGTLTVTVSKQQLSATNTWGAAITTDVDGTTGANAAVFDWIAIGN